MRSVEPGSPADRAGIKAGDQIVSIDDKAIDSEEAFETALSTRGPGKPMKIALKSSAGQQRTVTVSGQAPPADYGVRLLRESIGMTLRETRDGLRLATVESGGAAARAGLERGDALVALNGDRGQFDRGRQQDPRPRPQPHDPLDGRGPRRVAVHADVPAELTVASACSGSCRPPLDVGP